MKRNIKTFLSFLLVGVLSAGIAVGFYAYLNPAQQVSAPAITVAGFDQGSIRPVALNAIAAEATDFTVAAERSVNAVVHIKAIAQPNQRRGNYTYDPLEFFFGLGRGIPQTQQPRVGFGSGVIISVDGYIVTNNHVISGADEIEVTTNNNETYKAQLIGTDESTDLALLKIEGKDFPIIPFGDSDALKVGEWVLAVGNPFNLTSTVTAGIVSATGRGGVIRNRYNNSDAQKIQSFIQTDAAVNPGNSGGALVNTRGELIGINTLIYSETGNFAGHSFAVPSSIVMKVVSDIRQYGAVQRALLGVTIMELPVLKEQNPGEYEKLKVHEGVYVAGFSDNSSAEKAGMKTGDVITAINGHKVKNFDELRAQISRYSPGDKVNVLTQRGKDSKLFEVELKNDQGNTEIVKPVKVSEVLGATFEELSDNLKSRFGVDYGIQLTKVGNGIFKKNGIKEGFIIFTANNERISTQEELERIVNDALKGNSEYRALFVNGAYPNSRVRPYAFDLSE